MKTQTKFVTIFVILFASVPFFRIFTLPAPIYTPDEYAYWRHAINMEHADQPIADTYARDPLLQRVNNFLYQSVVYYILSITQGNLTTIGIAQWFIWIAILFFIYDISKNLISNYGRYAPLILASLMPFSNYTRSIMPEIFLGMGFWLASWAMIKLPCNHKFSVPLSIFLGAVCSTWLFIKIHSLAFAIAAGITVAVLPFIYRDNLSKYEKIKYGLINFISFTTTFAIIRWIILIYYNNKIPSQETGGVFGSFYLGIFNKDIGIAELFGQTLFYIVVHANVLLIFFSAGIIFSTLLAYNFVKSIVTNKPRSELITISTAAEVLIIFWYLSLFIHLIMIAFFSTFAGIDNAFEYGRIHERYYWYIIPGLLIISTISFNYRSKLFIYISLLSTVASLTIFFLVTIKYVSVYPWDAPEYFALYQKSSKWEYISPAPWLTYLIGLLVVVYSFSLLVNERISLAVFFVQIAALFVASYIIASPWQYETSKNSFKMYSEGRAVSKTINPAANVIIVSNERYGPTSNFMMGFSQSPYFMLTENKMIIDLDPNMQYDLVAISNEISYIGTDYEKHPAELSTFTLYVPNK